MIAWLQGVVKKAVAEKNHLVILDVNSVGYQVFVSARLFASLPAPGKTLALDIYTYVKEDAIHLFGFSDYSEREVFMALISMSGIGPKAAMGILSGIDPRELIAAICSADMARLCAIPGIGKKKAERMVMDLKEKLLRLGPQTVDLPASTQLEKDLRSALANLGFKGAEVEKALAAMTEELNQPLDLDQLLPRALKQLKG